MLANRIIRPAVACALLLLLQPWAAAGTGGYAALVKQVAPSVVTVLVAERGEGAAQRAVERATADTPDSDARAFVRRMLSGPGGGNPAPDASGSALGSGFIISADGLIVTNRHVVVGARSVRVKLPDGREVPAKVIGVDATTDIALLRVSAGRLPALHLGSSDKVSVGDPVVAIGNPYGLGQSVTAGILSARGRMLEEDPYIDFLQTDAAINLGNSGGPLLSADGVVVGVNTAIFTPSGGSVGLGFAIPAETVTSVITELQAHGKVSRGYLGIEVQAMTPALARVLLGRDDPAGVLIVSVEPTGPTANELMVGDVLLSVGSTAVTIATLGKIAVHLVPGSTVNVSVMRDGNELPRVVTAGQLPDPPEESLQAGGPDTWVPNLELGVAKSTPDIRKALKAPDESGGLVVTQLRHDGAGALAGMKVGDLITHAGTKRLEDVADLSTVSKPSVSQPLLLRIIRNGSPGFIAVTGTDEH
jgi:serine protease Do